MTVDSRDLEALRSQVKQLATKGHLDATAAKEIDRSLDRVERSAVAGLEQQKLIQELQEQLKTYEEKFEEISQPPLLAAYVIRLSGPDLADGEVAVAHGNQVLKVTAGFVKKTDLKVGQYVWLHPKSYAIIANSERSEEGLVARVSDVLGDKMIVTLGEGFEKKVVPVDPEVFSDVKIGDEVSLLPPTYEVLEHRPSTEIRDLFLGERPNVPYTAVGGLHEVIDRIRDVVELPYREPELFKAIDLVPPRGVLVYGPPGCGKTLLAKAVATENDMTFFNVSIADILSKWVGESENMIKALFRKARESAPSIIFFDEFDALGTTRGVQDTAGVHKNIIAQILSEMDGIKGLRDVYILAATNRPDMIDPALLRPGRFDEVIEIPRPNRDGAREILRIYLRSGLPIHHDHVRESGSAEAASKMLLERILDDIYGDDKWVEIKVDAEAKETVKTVKRKDIVSGALLESIVRTAKKNYVKRAMLLSKGSKEREIEGIRWDDLTKAISEEAKEHALVESSVYHRRQAERRRFAEGVEVV